jgi:uncharacterized protein (DUF2249 family)/iron-sulfur cluster repair protein YtfE (RIC family)
MLASASAGQGCREDEMEDVMVASGEADSRAVEAVEQHHAVLAGALSTQVERLLSAGDVWQPIRDGLVAWCCSDLVPHAQAEERTLYPAAANFDRARLLVDAMVAEHGVISGLVEDLAGATDGVRAAATASALRTLFDSHLSKENDQVLPLLAQEPKVDLAGLLNGMHDLLGAEAHHAAAAESGCGGHECSCGEVDAPGYPELDARVVPHAIRHATIFGALEAVGPGAGLVLVAPHDPLPLLAQVEQRNPGVFEVSYLERGPESWRLLFARS